MATRPNKDEQTKEQSNNTEQQATPASNNSMPEYLQAALRISSSRPLGAPRVDTSIFSAGTKWSGAGNLTVGKSAIPGVCVLTYVPTLGVSTSANSALNRATYSEFNAIRSQISGNRPYQPADHMIYRMCVEGMRDLYAYVRRIYGVVRKYSAVNLYRPRAILTAMGLDADSWINNAANLYQWLLTHENALIPFPTVPIGTVSEKHTLYNSIFFTDGEPEVSQTYILNQGYFYSYENVDEVKGATIKPMPRTYEELLTTWDDAYAALQNSSDVYIIAADIRRAFADKVVTDLPSTDVNYVVEYVKFDPILTAIMNANICGEPENTDALLNAFKIVDRSIDGIGLYCAPYWDEWMDPSRVTYVRRITTMFNHLNMLSINPSAEDFAWATKFKPAILSYVSDDPAHPCIPWENGVTITAMGTEVVTKCTILGMNSDGTYNYADVSSTNVYYSSPDSDVAEAAHQALSTAARLSKFDWHPPVAYIHVDAEILSYGCIAGEFTFEDVQNYVPIRNEDLENIHEASILATFNV